MSKKETQDSVKTQKAEETAQEQKDPQTETETENKSSENTKEEEATDKVQNDTNEFEEKYNQLNDTHLRLMAEFDNYRKRAIKEKTELLKSANERLLINILPLIDDFERGMEAANKAEDVEAIKKGMELIYNKFTSFLTQNGVKTIEANDQPFDTDFHEAITTIPAPTEEQKGKVIDCVQKGYTLNDKVIRFSKVVVGQ